MVSEPDTVVRNVLLSQQSGATAVVTAEAHVPMMATTLSTSISLRAARTAASGLVWSSSLTRCTWRPSTPPAATIWIPMTETKLLGAPRTLRLEATLYRPARPEGAPVLIFNHGSTGNFQIAPTVTQRYPEVAQFFVERGFTVLIPMRRGRG